MNKDELARAVKHTGGQLAQVRALERRSSLRAMAAVLRMLAQRTNRVISPFATLALSAVIGAATPMVLVDSAEELAGPAQVALPTAVAQTASVQPRPGRVAARTPAHGSAPSTGAAPTIVLAEASGGSSTSASSAPQPVDHGTESPGPPGDSGPAPAVPSSDQPTDGEASPPEEVPAEEEAQQPTDEIGVTLCHKAGTPHEKTITVGPDAVDAHLAHGDTLGACS